MDIYINLDDEVEVLQLQITSLLGVEPEEQLILGINTSNVRIAS